MCAPQEECLSDNRGDVSDSLARPARLPRTLGFWSSVGLVVGITIGSGIFRTPAGIARLLPDPIAMLARLDPRRAHHAVRRSVVRRPRAGCSLKPAGSTPTCGKAGDGPWPSCSAGPSWCSSAPTPSAACRSCSGNTASGRSAWTPRPIRSWPEDWRPRPSPSPPSPTSVGARIGAAIVGWSTAAKFAALALLVGCAFALGRRPRRDAVSHFHASAPAGRPSAPAASAWRSSAFCGPTTGSPTCRSPAAR